MASLTSHLGVPSLCLSSPGITGDCHSQPVFFYVCSGDLNSDLHASKANTLSAQSSCQSPVLFLTSLLISTLLQFSISDVFVAASHKSVKAWVYSWRGALQAKCEGTSDVKCLLLLWVCVSDNLNLS